MRLPKLVGLRAFKTDDKDTVIFEFKSAEGRTHYVPMKVGVLNALLPVIINIRCADDADARGAAQPVTLTSARGAYHEDGAPLVLDGITIVIAVDQAPPLQQLVDILAGFQSPRARQSHARH